MEGLSKSNAHPEEGGGVFIRSVGSKLFDTLSTKEIAVPLKRENVLLVRNHVSRPDSAIGDSQSASNLYLRLRESSL